MLSSTIPLKVKKKDWLLSLIPEIEWQSKWWEIWTNLFFRSAGKESFLYRAVQPTSLAESPEGVEEFLTTLSTLLSPIATETTRSQLLIGSDSKQELVSPWDVPFLIHQGQRWSGFEVSKLKVIF